MLRRASAAASQFEIIAPQITISKFHRSCGPAHIAMPVRRPKCRTYLISGHQLKTLMRDALDRDRSGFAAADAQRRHTALEVLRLQRMQQCHDQTCAGCPDRMAERAGAAIDVEPVAGDSKVLLRGHCDDGE